MFPRVLGLLLILSSSAIAADIPTQQPSNEAVQVAKSMAGPQFRFLIARSSAITVTIRGLIAKYGQDKVLAVLQPQIEKVARDHDREWLTNLALSYQDNYSSDELSTLLREKDKAHYQELLKSREAKVGPDMQARSTELLTTATTEAVLNTFNSFSGK